MQVFINSVGDVAEDIRAGALADVGAVLAQDPQLLQPSYLMHLTNGLSDQARRSQPLLSPAAGPSGRRWRQTHMAARCL